MGNPVFISNSPYPTLGAYSSTKVFLMKNLNYSLKLFFRKFKMRAEKSPKNLGRFFYGFTPV